MAAWVLLRHDLPDGTWHHDWMLEDPQAPDGRLISFRIDPEVCWPPQRNFRAIRIAGHRREYLAYEGAVTHGRGMVRRIAGGDCTIASVAAELRIALEGRLLTGVPAGGAEGGLAEEPWEFQTTMPDLEAGRD